MRSPALDVVVPDLARLATDTIRPPRAHAAFPAARAIRDCWRRRQDARPITKARLRSTPAPSSGSVARSRLYGSRQAGDRFARRARVSLAGGRQVLLGDYDSAPSLLDRRLLASTITSCVGVDPTEGSRRTRSPRYRLGRRSGHRVAVATRAASTRPLRLCVLQHINPDAVHSRDSGTTDRAGCRSGGGSRRRVLQLPGAVLAARR
jgi:hypothetical protein